MRMHTIPMRQDRYYLILYLVYYLLYHSRIGDHPISILSIFYEKMTNSRTKWHNYERIIAKEYRERYPQSCTSRAESKNTDDKGIDLCFTDRWQVQCKSYRNFPVAEAIRTLKRMPKGDNILHIKITSVGEAVVMDKDTRYSLLSQLQPWNHPK